jgi:hypothetical protein
MGPAAAPVAPVRAKDHNRAAAASWLYYSADNGKTWRTVVTYLDGGLAWQAVTF